MKKVGFIGTGIMGRRMCIRIVNAGYEVYVNDINPDSYQEIVKLGGKSVATPAEVGKNSDVVLASLPNSKIIESVMFGKNGLHSGLSAGKVFIDLSSSQASSTQMISKRLEEIGVKMLDAPVSGGAKGAEEGKLTIMIGGSKDTLDESKDILDILGSNIRHVGDIGAGNIVKAINQVLFSMNTVVAAEAVVLGTKAGVDPGILLEVINSGSGQSYATSQKIINFTFKRNFTPGFTLDLMAKDMDIALNMGRELKVPMQMANIAREALLTAQNKGLGGNDCTAVIQLLEEITGVTVKPIS